MSYFQSGTEWSASSDFTPVLLSSSNVISFYGVTADVKGRVGPAFLSNFFMSSFQLNGTVFPSVEHCYQYHKILHFRGSLKAYEILGMSNATSVKQLTKRIMKGVNSKAIAQWKEQNGLEIMKEAIIAKFEQNHGLASALKRTGSSFLVHAHEGERLWGVGQFDIEFRKWLVRQQSLYVSVPNNLSSSHLPLLHKLGNSSCNVLGYILMATRERLQRQDRYAVVPQQSQFPGAFSPISSSTLPLSYPNTISINGNYRIDFSTPPPPLRVTIPISVTTTDLSQTRKVYDYEHRSRRSSGANINNLVVCTGSGTQRQPINAPFRRQQNYGKDNNAKDRAEKHGGVATSRQIPANFHNMKLK